MITLPALPYDYNALEPFIDEETMRIHHTKHHQAYIDKLNTVLEKHPDIQSESVESLLKKLDTLSVDDADRTLLKNHGGGHVNHAFFWTIMGKTKSINQNLTDRIIKKFGSVEDFRTLFTQTAMSHFGSGWVWLVTNEKDELELYATPNQDSPHLKGHTPKIALDLWEHAYYLKYKNLKAEYIKNWWNVLSVL